jgi:hypothetical protein
MLRGCQRERQAGPEWADDGTLMTGFCQGERLVAETGGGGLSTDWRRRESPSLRRTPPSSPGDRSAITKERPGRLAGALCY